MRSGHEHMLDDCFRRPQRRLMLAGYRSCRPLAGNHAIKGGGQRYRVRLPATYRPASARQVSELAYQKRAPL